MREKSDEYLAAGVEEVWVIDPKKNSVLILRSDAVPRTLSDSDVVTSPVLPGFASKVREFFEDL
jgi:Uma2 family endonuclease